MLVKYACKLLETCFEPWQEHCIMGSISCISTATVGEYPSHYCLIATVFKKANTPAMVKHGIRLVQAITAYLNPDQILVLACDQPIFTQCKYIQWKWPGICGENKMIIMLGGLHVEKVLWYSFGDLLAFSGWTEALTEADVATSGTADHFLKASHTTHFRHAHQVTALALSKLQQDALDSSDSKDFEAWCLKTIKDSPNFHYWENFSTLYRIT